MTEPLKGVLLHVIITLLRIRIRAQIAKIPNVLRHLGVCSVFITNKPVFINMKAAPKDNAGVSVDSSIEAIQGQILDDSIIDTVVPDRVAETNFSNHCIGHALASVNTVVVEFTNTRQFFGV